MNATEIDLTAVQSGEQLHALLAKHLGFPSFYGHNWDAFWDAITGLVEIPALIHFMGWSGFAERLPADARQLRTCMDEFTAAHPTHHATRCA